MEQNVGNWRDEMPTSQRYTHTYVIRKRCISLICLTTVIAASFTRSKRVASSVTSHVNFVMLPDGIEMEILNVCIENHTLWAFFANICSLKHYDAWIRVDKNEFGRYFIFLSNILLLRMLISNSYPYTHHFGRQLLLLWYISDKFSFVVLLHILFMR